MLPAQKPTPSPSPTPLAASPSVSSAPRARSAADKVLSLYLTDQSTTVCEIADHLNLSVEEVAEILDSPKSQALLATIRRLAQTRAEIIAAEVRTEAIYLTRRIANSATNQETARRAAAALLRFSTVTPPRERSEQAPSPATRGGGREGQVDAQHQPGGGSTPHVPNKPPRPAHDPKPIPVLTPEIKREALLALADLADRFTPNTPLPAMAIAPEPIPSNAPAPTRARDAPIPHQQAA